MTAIEGSPLRRRDVIAILIGRKREILITFFAIIATVVGGTALIPREYETRMKILVKNDVADMVVSAASTSGAPDYRSEVSEAQINTEIELLNSNDLLEEVVAKCGLERFEGLRGPLAHEKAVAHLRRSLHVSAVRKANIIEVKYAARESRLAAAVLRQLSESYLEAHLRVHATPGTYEFFTKQAVRYHNELKEAEDELGSFRQKSNIVMLNQQKDALLQKTLESEFALLQVDAAIREYREKIADTRQQLEAAPERLLTQSRKMPNQYSVERLRTMLTELQNRRTELLAKFRPDDRAVEEVNQEIVDTQASLNQATTATEVEEASDVNPVRQSLEIEVAKEQTELAGTNGRRQTLAVQAQSYHQQLMTLSDATSQYDDLTRNQKEAEENYLLYARKAEEARIAESLDQQKIANVAIAETPTERLLPSKPNAQLNLALGALTAFFVSVGLAFARERLGRPQVEILTNPSISSSATGLQPFLGSVENASDLEELTGLAVLATPHHS